MNSVEHVLVQVRLFARARDLAGSSAVTVHVPAPASVAQLRKALTGAFPALAPLGPRLLVAVESEYVDDTFIINPPAEIACFPPVSGG